MLFKFLIAILSVSASNGCLEIPSIENFDINRYVGRWYEIEKFPISTEIGLKCLSTEYSFKGLATFSINNTGFDIQTNEIKNKSSLAIQMNPNQPGTWLTNTVFLPWLDNRPYSLVYPYLIIDTDYENYSLIYSCTSVFSIKLEYSWILSRDRTLDTNTVQRLKSLMKSHGADIAFYESTDQTNCNKTQ